MAPTSKPDPGPLEGSERGPAASEGLRPGDLVWQRCMPGGLCIFLSERPFPWPANDGSYLWKVWHPVHGLIEDTDYYYQSIERAIEESQSRSR